MQFKLNLTKGKSGSALPLNYRYDFYKDISRLIDRGIKHHPTANPSDFGNGVSNSFTFGNFHFDSYEIHHQEERIVHHGREFSLEIRFLIEDEEEGFIKNSLLGQQVQLGDTSYKISSLKSVPPIEFQDVMVYRCMCPISLIAKCPSGAINFLSPDDKNFNNTLKIDLIKRLLRSHPEMSGLKDLDQYCPEFQFQLLSEPKEKGMNIKSNGTSQSVIGYQFDFQLKASPVLHELGFYEGFGLQHSMGLGFVEVIA